MSWPLPTLAVVPVFTVMVPVVVVDVGSPESVRVEPLFETTVRLETPDTLVLARVSPDPMLEAKVSPAGKEMLAELVEVVTWSRTTLGPRLVS